jgi:hypothetical protein
MTMNDDTPYRDMNDEELEGLISGLPGRQPRPALRDRVLLGARRPSARRVRLLRPAFALAALVILLLADMIVVGLQDAGLSARAGVSPSVLTAQRAPAERDVPAWLREIGAEELGPRIAWMVAKRPPDAATYSALLADLLQTGNGG